jgi:hypothetical protein
MWRRASTCVLSAAIAASGARGAFAADAPCSPIAVAIDEGVRARWPDLPSHLRQALATRTDIDTCARVELTVTDGSIALGVTLPDGRSASRQVARREDVLPTLEALLLVPRSAPEALVVGTSVSSGPPPAPRQPAEGTAIAPGQVRSAVPERREADTRPASYGGSRVGFELSVLTDARIGDGQTSIGLGAFSLLDIGGWLVGFEGRADQDREIGGGFAGAALELAALGGRRFRFQNLALDLAGGPAVALRGGGTDTRVTPEGTTTSQSTVGTVPRALLGTHLIFGARSSLRTFIGVDGEFGPATGSGPGGNPIDPARLPAWTVGFVLGATAGTQ